MIDYLILIAIGYTLGSVPFGLLAGLLLKRVDVRQFGSGKTGMTNVLRTVGVKAAVVVLLLDMGKAILSVVLARIISDAPGVEAAAGIAALVGHNWPVFVGFKGGRGTAPGWGGLFILSPWAGLVAALVGLPTIALTRYVSLGSILGASSGALTLAVLSVLGITPLEYVWFAAFGVTLVLASHKDNISRLIKGQERKMGQRSEATQPGASPNS